MYERYVKRILDALLAGLALIVLAIPMLLLALLIVIDDPGPVLFTQKRVGINRTYFNMHNVSGIARYVFSFLPSAA